MPAPTRNQARYDLVIQLRNEGKTFSEIAIALNVCKARASQMYAREIARIETHEHRSLAESLTREVGKSTANVLLKNGITTKAQAKEAIQTGRHLARCGKLTRAAILNWLKSDT
jgi:hypothetical protein